MVIRPGDRVLFLSLKLYQGETAPIIPPLEWTGTVLSTWGLARKFCRVRRDFDGRILPVMESDIKWIGKGEQIARVTTREKVSDPGQLDEPKLF